MSCTKHKMLVHTIAMILYKKMRSLFMLWMLLHSLTNWKVEKLYYQP